MQSDRVIFFDGVCNLCSSVVQFVIQHDPNGVFKFAALQSDYSANILADFQLSNSTLETILLLENGKIYTKSSAVLLILKQFSGLWSVLYVFYIIPKFLRDFLYDLVARNRYKIWGKQAICWLPTPELQERFLG